MTFWLAKLEYSLLFRTAYLSFFLIFSVFLPQGFSAPSADVSLLKSEVATGETTELRIQIKWLKTEASYTFAIPELPLHNLTVLNQAESQETFLNNNQEWTQKVFIYELSPKEAGEGEIESFSVTYVNPATGVQGQLEVSALKVHVRKAKTRRNIYPFLFVSMGSIAGILFFIGFKRRKLSGKTLETEPQKRAIVALKERIQNSNASTENAAQTLGREFFKFLKEIYGADGSHKSETEMVAELKEKNLPSDEIKSLERILNQIRETKYTGQKLNDLDFQMLKKEIIAFIDSKQIYSFSSVN